MHPVKSATMGILSMETVAMRFVSPSLAMAAMVRPACVYRPAATALLMVPKSATTIIFW